MQFTFKSKKTGQIKSTIARKHSLDHQIQCYNYIKKFNPEYELINVITQKRTKGGNIQTIDITKKWLNKAKKDGRIIQ